MENIATRAAYGEALAALAKDCPELVVLDADLSGSTMSKKFADVCPERFFNIGIAEANMAGIAAGLATCGKKPFIHSFAMFAAGRAWEQVRNSIAYPRLNVKVIGSHGGLSVGEDGATHQCIEDYAIMRAIPGMMVVSPCDGPEMRLAVKALLDYEGPAYMRLGRLAVDSVTDEVPGYTFQLGRGCQLREGADVTVIAAGMMVQEAVKASDALKAEGVVLFENKADVEEFGKVLFHDGHTNPELVGKDAPVIAKAAGFDIPADTKVVGLKIDAVGKANVLNKEIMGPIVVLKSYETFEEAVAMAIQNMEEAGGIGHTAGIFSNDRAHVEYYAERIPVARVLVNQPTPDAWGPSTNGLSPAVSESCGTWGNNILCENVDYRHLINISKIALPLDVDVPSAEELFKD